MRVDLTLSSESLDPWCWMIIVSWWCFSSSCSRSWNSGSPYSYFTSDGSQVVIMGSAGLGAAPFISRTKYDNNNIGISPLNTIIMDSRKFFYFLIRKYWICLIEVSSYFIAWAISLMPSILSIPEQLPGLHALSDNINVTISAETNNLQEFF